MDIDFAEISELTAANSHVEAMIVGCQALGLTDTESKLRSFRGGHNLKPHTGYSGADYAKKDALYLRMMTDAESILSAEDFNQFRMCF